ncbi:MAG: hypothetical protein WKG07_26055 [Hymenobacter sp.]
MVLVKVVVTSGREQASATYYGQPQSQMVLFPNLADGFADVANVDETPAPSRTVAPLRRQLL